MKVKIICCGPHDDFDSIASGKRVFNIVKTHAYFDAKVDDGLLFVDTIKGEAVIRVVRQVEEGIPGFLIYGFNERLADETFVHIVGFDRIEEQLGLFRDERDGAIVNVRDEDFLARAKWHSDELRRKLDAVIAAGRG